MRDGPLIRDLGFLAPDAGLCERASHPDFPLGSFFNYAESPAAFKELLRSHGYRVDSSIDAPTLIASTKGVSTHDDYQMTAVWTLLLPDTPTLRHRLVLGDEIAFLRVGHALLFDASVPHRLVTRSRGRWALLSAYVSKL